MREKREAEGGNGDHPVFDNMSMFISYRVYSQDIFTNTNIQDRKSGIYGSYGIFVNNVNIKDQSFMESEGPVRVDADKEIG
jgi:hypothetical protein